MTGILFTSMYFSLLVLGMGLAKDDEPYDHEEQVTVKKWTDLKKGDVE